MRGSAFVWGARTYLMGIVNVTPDSFSGDGAGGDVPRAVEVALAMAAEGADIIDIGAESSRPGARPVDAAEELERLLPPLRAIRAATGLPISVDTYRASVAETALANGADAINDISGLRADPAMARVIAAAGAPLFAMHNQRGREHHDVASDILSGFEVTIGLAGIAGIDPARVVLDPGFGFGWTAAQNLEMVRRLPELWGLKLPLLVGPSRKSTIGTVLGEAPVGQRLEGTAGAVAASVAAGADIVRVHDVAEMRRMLTVLDAVVRGWP
ncbi:hypothetical protein AYO38_09930 [bacterium SCGC AG-212-C10]|nr:hypothetical protein AYO38_09930 [bacterium SCGC AG-212-C10]